VRAVFYFKKFTHLSEGIGHRSRAGALARDPASDAFASSSFRFLEPNQQKSKQRSRSYTVLILRALWVDVGTYLEK
jgi:hypothetical protein